MRLPNADRAVVALNKVTDYLLNAAHPDNGGKAKFFEAMGFSPAEPARLSAALREVAMNGSATLHSESTHGAKFIVDGPITALSGKQALVRTVWIIDREQQSPRLVTAYPHEE